jgi:hypothetical protein
MREWICHLQLLLVLSSAVNLRSESRGTHDHILLSQIRDSPNLEGQVLIVLQITPWRGPQRKHPRFYCKSIVVCISFPLERVYLAVA